MCLFVDVSVCLCVSVSVCLCVYVCCRLLACALRALPIQKKAEKAKKKAKKARREARWAAAAGDPQSEEQAKEAEANYVWGKM